MIELGSFPFSWRMALSAIGAAVAAMHIVWRMTRYALLGRFFVAIAEVARKTRHIDMFVAQRELC
jgi:hypothetical protein